ncbi:ParE family toxin-like protein [Pantoea vagans]
MRDQPKLCEEAGRSLRERNEASLMAKPFAPDRIRKRARRTKDNWRAGLIHARRTYRDGYLTLRVTPQWRLLSRDNGQSWELLSHADYDNQI